MTAAALQEESQLIFTKNLLPAKLLDDIMAASQKKQASEKTC